MIFLMIVIFQIIFVPVLNGFIFCVFFVQIRCHFITTGIIKNNCYISILDWNPLSLRLKNPTTRATEESVHVAAGVVDRHTEDQFFYAVCFNSGPWFRFSNPLCSDFYFSFQIKNTLKPSCYHAESMRRARRMSCSICKTHFRQLCCCLYFLVRCAHIPASLRS